MIEQFDLILKGGIVALPSSHEVCDVGVTKGRIAAIGSLDRKSARQTVNCAGLCLLPGVIDSHVHFREPGGEKGVENLTSGSLSAVLGGVTSVFEMPNTSPPTTTLEALSDKLFRADGRMACNYGFYIGATKDNLERLNFLEKLPGCAGVKVFVGSSTGDLLVDGAAELEAVFDNCRRLLVFHCEDEERLRLRAGERVRGDPNSHTVWRDELVALAATKRVAKLADKYRRRGHILHVSSAEELDFLARYRSLISVEVTTHHLTLTAPEAYDLLGSLAQVNPPIRTDRHRRMLWQALAEGRVDTIGSDHAPHSLANKAKPYPQSPSGLPGTQTLVPIMLDHVANGRLSLAQMVKLTSTNPARIFGAIAKGRLSVGFDADITIVDLKRKQQITNSWIASGCGWTPYHGKVVRGWPVGTFVNGVCTMWQDELLVKNLERFPGKPVKWRL